MVISTKKLIRFYFSSNCPNHLFCRTNDLFALAAPVSSIPSITVVAVPALPVLEKHLSVHNAVDYHQLTKIKPKKEIT